jgi:GT2 family glycosyltransferase
MKTLSIVIVSYNTKEVTIECLQHLRVALAREKSLQTQVIIVDNKSTDGSVDAINTYLSKLPKSAKRTTYSLIVNKRNVGYGKANNQGFAVATGEYVLLLNSDALIKDVNFQTVLYYMDSHPQVGVLTVKVLLPNGSIDPASHRGFPTLWRSFTYFAKLEQFLGRIPVINSLVGGYHLTYLNLNTIHEIDSPAGAFFLTRKDILNKVKGFDTDFFMYGEDLDLSYRIKMLGYQIIYYPNDYILHFKHTSGIKKSNKEIQARTKRHFYEAMKIFYDKHYAVLYPAVINKCVHTIIDIKARS